MPKKITIMITHNALFAFGYGILEYASHLMALVSAASLYAIHALIVLL